MTLCILNFGSKETDTQISEVSLKLFEVLIDVFSGLNFWKLVITKLPQRRKAHKEKDFVDLVPFAPCVFVG